MGQAAALAAALDQELVRALGALPVLLPILEQLGFRERINQRCAPTRTTTTELDPGLVILLLGGAAAAGPARISRRSLIEQFAALSVLILVFQDGSQVRRLAGLSPPLADILQALGLPPADRYLTVHG